MQPLGGVGKQVAVLVNRAALGRHLAPERGQRLLQPAPAVNNQELRLMQPALDELASHGIPYELEVRSAHRNPDAVAEYARSARERGLKVLIAGAGLAAALPGVVAAQTDLPVIGVGGISGADDAKAMMDAGASLVQVYSGLIYQGPALIRRINRALPADAAAAGRLS